MPILLRIEMIVVAVSFMALVFRTVNRKKLKLQYSLLWIVVSFGMIVVSFIPQVAMWFASVMRIQTTSNLILFLGVVALLAITFNLTIILSKQSDRVMRLVQTVSIENYLREEEREDISNGG